MLPKVWIHIYLLYFVVCLWKAYYKLDRLVSTSICLPYLKLLLLTLILFVIVLTVNNMGPIVLLTFEITNSGAIILCYLWGSFMKFNKKLVQYQSIVKCLSSCIFASILALSSSFTTEGWPNDSLSWMFIRLPSNMVFDLTTCSTHYHKSQLSVCKWRWMNFFCIQKVSSPHTWRNVKFCHTVL